MRKCRKNAYPICKLARLRNWFQGAPLTSCDGKLVQVIKCVVPIPASKHKPWHAAAWLNRSKIKTSCLTPVLNTKQDPFPKAEPTCTVVRRTMCKMDEMCTFRSDILPRSDQSGQVGRCRYRESGRKEANETKTSSKLSSEGSSARKHERVRMENQQCFCQYLKQSHQWYLDPLAVLDLKLVQVLHA